MRQSGSVIGVALFGALIADTFASGMHTSLLISLAVIIIATGLARTLVRSPA